MDELEIRKAVLATAQRMLEAGLVVGTWGNVSARLDGARMVITPSGMDYLSLEPDDMVVVDIETLAVKGRRRPSTETPMHAAIYSARPEVGAIVHTHSSYVTAVAAARREIPPLLDELVQVTGGSVRVAEYAFPGSWELARAVVGALEGRTAVVLANHGGVCVGRTLDEAIRTAMVLEKSAMAFVCSHIIGGPCLLASEHVAELRRMFLESYGQHSGK
ncbi:MAG: class II aldolase/adducin family protein [Bacillota bacterium]